MKQNELLLAILVDIMLSVAILALIYAINSESICCFFRETLCCYADVRIFLTLIICGLSLLPAIYRAAVHQWALVIPLSVIGYIIYFLLIRTERVEDVGWVLTMCFLAIIFFHSLIAVRTISSHDHSNME